VGGYAWEKVGLVWYVALRDRLRRRSTFQRAANVTVEVARELFGEGSAEEQAIVRAWSEVGLAYKLARKRAQIAA
jgi:Zn-dependent metalloprotease